jgi:hypothetical protein
MSKEYLYPVDFSTYTNVNGQEYDVPCTIPGVGPGITDITCPDPFVPPAEKSELRNCVKQCPVHTYSHDEYDVMWLTSGIISGVGMLLNAHMAATWAIAGPALYAGIRFQIRFCVFAGLLYGLIDTIPMLALKHDLACECATEECAGTSVLCALNRASEYILLGIMINLSALTYSLHATLDANNPFSESKERAVEKMCVIVPLSLMALGYLSDDEANMTDNAKNGVLNVARHAFKCNMRFSSMLEEWLLLWVHFLWSGGLIAIYSALTWLKIGRIQVLLGLGLQARTDSGRDTHIKIRCSFIF